MPARTRLCGLLVIGLLLALGTGCGTPAQLSTTPTPLSTADNQRQAVLYLWHAWPAADQRVLGALIDQYNRATPQVQVIPLARPASALLNDLRQAAVEGSGPHLMLIQSHTLGLLSDEHLLHSLDTLITASERDLLLPTAVGGGQITTADGTHVYGIPLTFDTLALFYNRANLAVAPADTDALVRTAHGLTDTSTQPPIWGMALNLSLDRTIPYLYAFGGRIFNEKGALILGDTGRTGTERWLQWLYDLRQDPQFLAQPDGITVDNALMSQAALMTIDWASALPDYLSLWRDQVGVALLPRLSGEDQPPTPYVQSDLIAMNDRVTDPRDQQAAVAFIRYLLSEPVQRQLLLAGKQPVLRSLNLEGDSPELAAARIFREQALAGQPMPNSRLMNEQVWEVLDQMQRSVLRGLVTPLDAVTRADTTLRQRLGLPAR